MSNEHSSGGKADGAAAERLSSESVINQGSARQARPAEAAAL